MYVCIYIYIYIFFLDMNIYIYIYLALLAPTGWPLPGSLFSIGPISAVAAFHALRVLSCS